MVTHHSSPNGLRPPCSLRHPAGLLRVSQRPRASPPARRRGHSARSGGAPSSLSPSPSTPRCLRRLQSHKSRESTESVGVRLCPLRPGVAGRGAGLEGLTCTDQGTVVVQGPEVRPGQRQERVQLAEVIPEAGPRQDRADDNVAQRMANEAGWRQKQCGWAWQREAARGSCTGPWGGPPSTSHWLQGPGQQNGGSGPSSAGFPAPAMPSLPRDLREWKPPCPVRSEEKLGFLLVLHY